MIDSHAHVAFDSFDSDRAAVIARLPQSGVRGWIEVGTDLEQSAKAVALAEEYEQCWASVGVHPSDIAVLDDAGWNIIEGLLQKDKIVAVGEVGFDFYRGGSLEDQKKVLTRFAELARERELPMIFHVRDQAGTRNAHEAMLNFLKDLPNEKRPGGVIHTFSGTVEQAKEYLALGLYLSFSGVVTFPTAGEIAEVAKTMPIDRVLIETDCPFLTPDPYRGKRNEPAYVSFVAQRIAELRGLSVEEVDQDTEENTRRLFAKIN